MARTDPTTHSSAQKAKRQKFWLRLLRPHDRRPAAQAAERKTVRTHQQDPITVARYFDHRFACLRNYMFDKHGGPFKDNPIVDYDYRIEFHNKGSPHAHMLVWNRDAPEFDKYEFITRDRRLTYKDGYGAVNDEQGEDKSYEEGEPVVTESQLEKSNVSAVSLREDAAMSRVCGQVHLLCSTFR